MHPTRAALAGIAVLVCAAGARAQATFTPLGYFALSTGSASQGISGDGTVALGNSGPPVAYRWTSADGMVGLGTLPGLFHSTAYAASTDGSAITGLYTFSSGEARPFRWTSAGGMAEVTGFPATAGSRGAFGISDDGAVVVGHYMDDIGYRHAFYQTEAGGVVSIPPVSGTYLETRCAGISRDGTRVIGSGINSSGFFEGYRYTISSAARVMLGDLAGGAFQSWAEGANATGDVIVGYSESSSGLEAFRWTPGGGMVGLGDLAGGAFGSDAHAVSSDGSVIVGDGTDPAGSRAMIWTAGTGMIGLQGYLASLGATGLAGWTLYTATGISADGLTITGTGMSPDGTTEAWVATIPAPGSGILLMAVGCIALRRGRAAG